MSDTYDDGRIACTPEGLDIRNYYFPAGTKHVPYEQIRGIHRFEIRGVWSGKWRIWGTGNPRYWANLDFTRPQKGVGFVIDLHRRISPIVTPDRPDEFDAVLRARTHLPPGEPHPMSGPFI